MRRISITIGQDDEFRWTAGDTRFIIELPANSSYVDLRENHFGWHNTKKNEHFAAERGETRKREGRGRGIASLGKLTDIKLKNKQGGEKLRKHAREISPFTHKQVSINAPVNRCSNILPSNCSINHPVVSHRLRLQLLCIAFPWVKREKMRTHEEKRIYNGLLVMSFLPASSNDRLLSAAYPSASR